MTRQRASPQLTETGKYSDAKSPASTTQLVVKLFGGCVIELGGREVAIANKKGKALLSYLAFAPNHSETRERLVGILWSEMPEDKARANLRQTLHSLRDTLATAGFNGFNTFFSNPGFEPGSVRYDATEALASVAADWPIDVLLDRSRVADTLLAGLEDVDPSFRSWLAVQRESLAQKLIRELQDRLGAQPGATPAAYRLALALLQLDPTHEPACRCVMRARADAGDSAGAIVAFNRLYEVLDNEHGQPPDEATTKLIVAIKDGSYQSARRDAGPAGPPAVPAVLAGLPGPAIAVTPAAAHEKLVLIVGPFDYIGERKELALAFRHELISRLTKFREWLLVDGEPATPPVSGNTPCYTLLAPVMEREHDVNLFLTLKDTRSGIVVWSERYGLELKSFFKALQEVMRQVAAKLNVYISVERLNRLAVAPDVSGEVYDRWLLGQSLLWRSAERKRLVQVLESITRDAPNFSPAYSALSQMCNIEHLVLSGTYRTIERQRQSLAYANEAVRLDPLDSRAQLALAWALMLSGQYDQAAAHFDYAGKLNEYDAWTMISCALGFAFGADVTKAEDFATKAFDLSPSPSQLFWCYQSNICFLSGNFEKALSAAAYGGDIVSNLAGWRAAALARVGRLEEARAEARHFTERLRAQWHGNSTPTDAAIARWFLHCFPIRSPEALQNLRDGLAAAGLTASAD